MRGNLLDPIDPEAEANRDVSFRGALGSADLPRLREQLLGEGSSIDFEIHFHRDVDGRHVVTGALRGGLMLQCQRCLQPLRVPVDHAINLAMVRGIDEGDRLPSRYEPLLLGSRFIRPIELLEDEIILLVPLVPRHEEGECPLPRPGCDTAAAEGAGADRAARYPFAGLADWRRRDGRPDSD